MNIAIIGTIMRDEIETTEGHRFESFGGILYNALAIGAVAAPTDRILPIAYMGADHLAEVRRRFFDADPRIDPSYIHVNPAGTDHNWLKYVTAASRNEKMTVVTPPHTPDILAPAADCDAVVVNFINGREVTLETFRHLRAIAGGLIYFDVHNLGKRFVDGVPVDEHFDDWAPWIANADIVQGNEWEARRLFRIHPKTDEECRAAVLRFLEPAGPRAAVLTLGGLGCGIAWREDGGIRYARIRAMPGLKIVDTTGCGDSFSAGFLVSYLRTGDPLRAAVFAATLSGLNCMQEGLAGLSNIHGVEDTMHAAYGDLLAKIDAGWRGEAV